jgi:Flp pilus assembly protein TadG
MAVMLRSFRQGESGAELIEFALVLPLFLLVTAGIIDFGFVFQQYNVITNAAREGARLAAVPNSSQDAVKNRVNAYVKAGGLPATATTQVDALRLATVPGGPMYNGVKVTVTYPCQFLAIGQIASWFGKVVGPPTLKAQSIMRHESQ